jgi:hypothetical protein
MAMDAYVDDMEADRGLVPEKNEVMAVNMVLIFVVEHTVEFAMVPRGNGVQRSGSPGNNESPRSRPHAQLENLGLGLILRSKRLMLPSSR